MLPYSTKVGLLWLLAALVGLGLFLAGPLEQDQAYHSFADKRQLGGIANFADVITNVPFLVIGIFGLIQAGGAAGSPKRRLYWRTFFLGVALIGIGSAYYHLNPNDGTLLWDRLPMTLAFMAFLTLLIDERIGERAAARLFPLLIGIGVASVLQWRLGSGDLRFYAFVQFFPLLAIPLLLVLFPGPPRVLPLHIAAVVSYALAKVLESLDAEVFARLGVFSGHSLKHLAAAAAIGFLYRLMHVGESRGERFRGAAPALERPSSDRDAPS